MLKKIVTVFASSGLMLGLIAAPAFAQNSASSVASTIQACNQTAKSSLKATRDAFKAKSITEDQRNAQVKAAEQTRQACVKSAREAAVAARKAEQADLKAKREAAKAKVKAARTEAKAKREAAKAQRQAQRAERKAAKVTPTPSQ